MMNIIKLSHNAWSEDRFYRNLKEVEKKINEDIGHKLLHYDTMSKNKFPFKYKDFEFDKVEVEEALIYKGKKIKLQ